MPRGRRKKVEIEETANNAFNESQVIEKQAQETAERKVVVDKWYAINGKKLLQRVKTGSGVHSTFIGLTTQEKTKEFVKKLKAKGERIENIV